MDYILWFVDFVLHLDVKLDEIVQDYEIWTYAILFVILFCETGLVVTPFLPGDSLLFAVARSPRARTTPSTCGWSSRSWRSPPSWATR